MTEPSSPPDRVRVRRLADKAAYGRATIDALLDGANVCHVGIVVDGQPFVIPTIYVRLGDEVVLHGSVASRLARHVRTGAAICVTVTQLDGLVLARSAFETSMNYRSVVVLGTGRELTEPAERLRALEAISEAVLPGRWRDVRGPSDAELRQTMLVAVTMDECSAKVSDGWPDDADDDLDRPTWAGRVPLRTVPGDPEPAPDLRGSPAIPGYVRDWVEGQRAAHLSRESS